MSLVTIQRSPTPPDSVDSSSNGNYDDSDECKNQSEDFFALKAMVVLQNHVGRRRSSVIKEEDTMQTGLLKIVGLLRKEDSLILIVGLEKVNSKIEGCRYFCVVLTNGKQDTEEYLILGVDICGNCATIGLVLPICQDMSVTLDGDGGFKVKNIDGEKLFKPSSVHALWLTVQLLNKSCSIARKNNYYIGGLSHTWIGYYLSKINSNRAQIAEWNRMLYADTVTNSNLAPKSAIGEFVIGMHIDESITNKDEIRRHLKDIMRDEDMDNVTVVFIREKLQEKVSFNLKDYRSFVAEEILIIYGQMDIASEILPYLYLGSTYNASNLEELEMNKVTHIINVTKESENFFRDKFIYRNVEVFDSEDTQLLNHFNGCYQFINEAKDKKTACLVHCQRGISRSASVVIAYMMKEFNWSLDKALCEVKLKRECILPNDGFMAQLKTYEGILNASAHRHNQQFQADSRSQRKSFPDELYHIHERNADLESPTNSATIARHRQSATEYDNSSHHLVKLVDDSVSVEQSMHPPVIYYEDNTNMNPSNTLIQDSDKSTTLERNDSVKRLLRLKEDASWIKQHVSHCPNIAANREEACRSCLLENVEVEYSDDGTEEYSRKCHSAVVDSAMLTSISDEDNDESQRPVKELLTKYSNADT